MESDSDKDEIISDQGDSNEEGEVKKGTPGRQKGIKTSPRDSTAQTKSLFTIKRSTGQPKDHPLSKAAFLKRKRDESNPNPDKTHPDLIESEDPHFDPDEILINQDGSQVADGGPSSEVVDPDDDSDEARSKKILDHKPTHDAPIVDRGRGKIASAARFGNHTKVERMPTVTDLQYHAIMSAEKTKFIATDPITKSIKNGGDPATNIGLIKLAMAREASSLHFQRIETEKHGSDTSQISMRRVEVLDKLAKLELKALEADRDSINLSSDNMQKVFKLWIETIRELAVEILPPELFDLFFNRFSTAMEGWEERAENTLR